ncbi:MAG: hypothetical protein RLP09_07950 [Sandaracinaceae bacterium]
MGLRVEERSIDTTAGVRKAWILSPTERVRVGRDRLERYRREGPTSAPLDLEMLAAVRRTGDESQLVVFCGRDASGDGSWGFEEGLGEEEAHELGYHLVCEQLPVYRRLVAAGVYALLHVDFGPLEVDAYQHGTRRLLEELERGSIPEVGSDPDGLSILQADRWILHNLCFFFTLPLQDVTQTILRRQLPLLESRVPHLRELTASLPAAAID